MATHMIGVWGVVNRQVNAIRRERVFRDRLNPLDIFDDTKPCPSYILTSIHSFVTSPQHTQRGGSRAVPQCFLFGGAIHRLINFVSQIF